MFSLTSPLLPAVVSVNSKTSASTVFLNRYRSIIGLRYLLQKYRLYRLGSLSYFCCCCCCHCVKNTSFKFEYNFKFLLIGLQSQLSDSAAGRLTDSGIETSGSLCFSGGTLYLAGSFNFI